MANSTKRFYSMCIMEKEYVYIINNNAIWNVLISFNLINTIYIVCIYIDENNNSIEIASRSVSNSLYSQQNGYVRGFLQISGYILQPYNASYPVLIDTPVDRITIGGLWIHTIHSLIN